jgi:toxin HigB-1
MTKVWILCPPVALYNQMRYTVNVLRSFAGKESRKPYITGNSRKLPPDIIRQTLRKLEQVNSAGRVEDLMTFPGNKLEPLKGKLRGKYSIRINDQWRIVFSFAEGDAYDVEITDYHR